MLELIRTLRSIGVGRVLALKRAQRLVWSEILGGFYTTRTLQALINVGFFDALGEGGSVNVESFAQANGLNARMLKALCDSLYAQRILRKNGPSYSLDTKGELLIGVARGWLEGVYGYEEVFHSLEALLTGQKEYGRDVGRRLESIVRGNGLVGERIYFPLAAEIVADGAFKKVLELGCGHALFLQFLCRDNPKISAYGVDRSAEILTQGRRYVSQAGLKDRVHLLQSDVFRLEQIAGRLKGVDIAFAFFLFHELLSAGADAVIAMLQRFRAAFPGTTLVVFETIRPDLETMRKRPGMAVHYFLHHDLTNQNPIGREEWQELFGAAGFGHVVERYLPFARTSIYTLHAERQSG